MLLRKTILVLFIFNRSCCFIHAQIPFVFQQQEKYVNKQIHRYLKKDTVIETSGAKIHINYSNNTDKPFLLLLHGMGANARSNWFKQVPYLSRYYNLLVPDLIYFGESTSKESDYSPEFQAMQLNQVIKVLNITGEINIIGFSYGGLVAAIYNQLFPDHVGKLVVIAGPVKFFSRKMADSAAFIAGASDITTLLVPQTLKDLKCLQKAALSKTIPTTKSFKKKLIAHFFTPYLDTRKRQISYLFANQLLYQNYNYNLNTTPTLLVWGSKDGVVPLSVGKSLNACFPKTTQLLVFKKAKHDVQFRYSNSVNKAIVEFLKSN
jgi:pimeloyl-ACP methyl ester carboxylesterase